MSLSRLPTGAAAALFASALSVDPRVRAPAPIPPRPLLAREISRPSPPAHAIVEKAGRAVDVDLEVELTPDPHGGHRLVLRRRGHLVSLRHENARAAGEDWTSIHLARRPDGLDHVQDRLIWETTRLKTLDTMRGIVAVSLAGRELHAELLPADRPESAGGWKSALATCAAQHDGLGGFTVLCRFAKGARHVGAANVTGARSLDDVWVTSGPSPLVRLELPYQAGGAQGRVIGFSHGMNAVALRVEASFPEGEPATLVIDEAQRGQPSAPF